MVLPSVKPLHSVVELGEEARRAWRELLGDLADQPAMRRRPAHEDQAADQRLVKQRRLRLHVETFREIPLDLAGGDLVVPVLAAIRLFALLLFLLLLLLLTSNQLLIRYATPLQCATPSK